MRKLCNYSLGFLVLQVVFGICIARGQDRESPGVKGRHEFCSPDGTLVGTVVSLKQKIYGLDPSRIEIRDNKGHLVAIRNHSMAPNQGLTVVQAAWTKDSRFFVYKTVQSGGHEPINDPSFFYSREKHRFYILNSSLSALGGGNGWIDGGFKLRSPSKVDIIADCYGESREGLSIRINPKDPEGDRFVEIDLKWLETRLTKKDASTDGEDRKCRVSEK